MLAGIRNKARCPCPRCLIPKALFKNLGMVRDMQQRETLRRMDDESKKNLVATAREIIYKKNYAVNYEGVDALLKEQSLVPSAVSNL
jgi:hypothetical protein